ncbi:AsmA-like C-terminal region-containing protein [Ruegeria sp. SCP11]|uniref:AsmA-like C-terminal region-containing protein n=1 Tax=Ruegeria sp. SCP11 TaxID=3141378 RepID=UPI00333C4D3C
MLRLGKILLSIGIAIIFVAAGIWMVLSAEAFANFRKTVFSDILSNEVGAEFQILGDVRLILGRTSTIQADHLEILQDGDYAKLEISLEHARLDFDTTTLLVGDFDIRKATISGVVASMERDQADRMNFDEGLNAFNFGARDSVEYGLFDYFRTRELTLESIQFTSTNERSGFDFKYVLDRFVLQQATIDKPGKVEASGSVNGQPFDMQGHFEPSESFAAKAGFGDLTISVREHFSSENSLSADIDLSTSSLLNTFQTLGLQAEAEADGSAHFTAVAEYKGGKLGLRDISIKADFEDDVSLKAEGKFADLARLDGLDLNARLRLVPDEDPIPSAVYIEDYQILGAVAHLTSDDGKFKFDNAVIETNSVTRDLHNLGPISAQSLSRTREGLLTLKGINIQIGPSEMPYLSASGEVGDLLSFRDILLNGKLNFPASYLVSAKLVEKLGRFSGSFTLSDEDAKLGLKKLSGRVLETDFWSLEVDASVPEFEEPNIFQAKGAAEWSEAREFFALVGTADVRAGRLSANVDVSSDGSERTLKSNLEVRDSSLKIDARAMQSREKTLVRGGITSPALATGDLPEIISVIIAVIDPKSSAISLRRSNRTPKPLMLDTRARKAKPLVLDPSSADHSPSSPKGLISGLDVELDVDVKHLRGTQGVSALKSKLTIQNGRLRIAPVHAKFDVAAFDLKAEVNLLETPDTMRLEGSMKGVDVGKVLKSAGVKLAASGVLSGGFDVKLNLNAPVSIKNLNGVAKLRIGDGRLASSVLELAGLGVLPWVFSKELSKGQTHIVCAVAPLSLQNGRVLVRDGVLETRSVQLVLTGEVDFRSGTLNLRGEPRPVGQPFARSPHPFAIHGRLTDPSVKVLRSTAPRGGPIYIKTHPSRKPCVRDASQFRLRRGR